MAFNFNWSPLTADANFYERAQEMLTTALNKSPKPPIIVDEILVNELNLGSVPPELEILEIGDLAEDRFRGIFKMCYSGDAFLTLKTRVQANPMNTYLFSKPSFTSPQPLAAASGLTIPLQITLSDIKMSAFIILVFSRQKGLTLVFRNDPLESMKVSSTFDSIPFVRDYLQKEIEMQLRTLMMDELPAIIHRLSLRLWCPEHVAKEVQEIAKETKKNEEVAIDPFASPPQDAVDFRGNVLDASEISSLSLDGGSENHSLFSQKNLLRLAALADSHRTLSLFTPSISDTVFRAWASPSERGETAGTATPVLNGLIRSHSSVSRSSDDGYSHSSLSSRPSLVSMLSTTGLSLGSARSSRSQLRKKKTRVVNLRKAKSTDNVSIESPENETECVIATGETLETVALVPEPEDNIITPPQSPSQRVRFQASITDLGEAPQQLRSSTPGRRIVQDLAHSHATPSVERPEQSTPTSGNEHYLSSKWSESSPLMLEKAPEVPTQADFASATSPIIEQAWILKMAGEIARRVQDEKASREGFWSQAESEDSPPPAYEPKAV